MAPIESVWSDTVAKKEEKTNVMRVLDREKIPYTAHTYPVGDSAPDGVTVAQMLDQDPAAVFKTLVAKGVSGGYYVFPIPVAATLDLKRPPEPWGRNPWPCCPRKSCCP